MKKYLCPTVGKDGRKCGHALYMDQEQGKTRFHFLVADEPKTCPKCGETYYREQCDQAG